MSTGQIKETTNQIFFLRISRGLEPHKLGLVSIRISQGLGTFQKQNFAPHHKTVMQYTTVHTYMNSTMPQAIPKFMYNFL
jgi:hypothetical protein